MHFLASVITTAFPGNYVGIDLLAGLGSREDQNPWIGVMTGNGTRRKKIEAGTPSWPTPTQSQGNGRCQGVCLKNLERPGGG